MYRLPFGLLLLVLLIGCGQASPTANTGTNRETRVVQITATETREQVEARYGGEIIVWRPEAGFAILSSDSDTTETQVAESGALRAWAGGLSAWAGALRAWAGGQPQGSGAVLVENALAWERLSLDVAHQTLAPKLGEAVIVAVIDTGLDLGHPTFAEKLDNPDNWYDFVDNDDRPAERQGEAYGHGTAVASVVLQVAPETILMPLRVLDTDGQGDIADIAAAIDWAVSRGADIIQLSLGTRTPAPALERMVSYAASQGVYVVTSAGNSDSNPTYPALSAMLSTPTGDMAVGVGSVNMNDQKSWFSNFLPEDQLGDGLEMVSFGEGIYAAFPGERVARWDGTSFAAPMVAGALALAIAEGAETLHPRRLGLKVVETSLDIETEGTSGGREFELEQRLEVGLFLCEALDLDATACAEAYGDIDDDENDSGDDEDDGGND